MTSSLLELYWGHREQQTTTEAAKVENRDIREMGKYAICLT